jgi:hypothetical protein
MASAAAVLIRGAVAARRRVATLTPPVREIYSRVIPDARRS